VNVGIRFPLFVYSKIVMLRKRAQRSRRGRCQRLKATELLLEHPRAAGISTHGAANGRRLSETMKVQILASISGRCGPKVSAAALIAGPGLRYNRGHVPCAVPHSFQRKNVPLFGV
jgi:hypothetical protein